MMPAISGSDRFSSPNSSSLERSISKGIERPFWSAGGLPTKSSKAIMPTDQTSIFERSSVPIKRSSIHASGGAYNWLLAILGSSSCPRSSVLVARPIPASFAWQLAVTPLQFPMTATLDGLTLRWTYPWSASFRKPRKISIKSLILVSRVTIKPLLFTTSMTLDRKSPSNFSIMMTAVGCSGSSCQSTLNTVATSPPPKRRVRRISLSRSLRKALSDVSITFTETGV
mmetsp:Transcript_36714/g.104460  ORF Transcript_36714/g.104460 Transcript_36714/m.104460 type:complete len:227 (+) Transcript_36714:326-1006(+)